MEGETKQQKDRLLPASILIAGILISVSVIYSTGKKSLEGVKLQGSVEGTLVASVGPEKMAEVTSADHIRGDAKAPVVVVEFSDLECPFCKVFHGTMQTIMKEYEGEVAWVYRHFPLDSLHPKARKEAEATECAAELGGNDAFWKYMDRLFELTPSNNGLDPNLLPQIAEETGLDKAKFESCLRSGKQTEKIQKQYEDALASGAKGTPYSVVITKNKERYAVPAALPLEDSAQGPGMRSVIEAALKK